MQRNGPRRNWFMLLVVVFTGIAGSGVAYANRGTLQDRYQSVSVVIKTRDSDMLPVAGARIVLAGKNYTSDQNGRVVTSLKVGTYPISIQKNGFQALSETFNVVRSTPVVSMTLDRTPVPRYVIDGYVQDALSGKPITNAKATLGSSTLLTNPAGQFEFSNLLPGPEIVTVSASGYLEQTLQKNITTANIIITPLSLVPAGQVVYCSAADAKHGIYTVGLDGSSPRRLIAAGNGEDFAPIVSPNGEHILFESTRDSGQLRQLYLANADGSMVKKVSQVVNSQFQPSWSLDSNFIYFAGYSKASLNQSTHQVYSLSTSKVIDLGSNAQDVLFAPNSKSLAYTTLVTQSGVNAYELRTMDLTTGTSKAWNSRPLAVLALRFSQDSARISYQTVQDTTIQRYELELASGQEATVPSVDDATRRYAVSADGLTRAAVISNSGQNQLVVSNVDGTNSRSLTTPPGLDDLYLPVWDSSGRYLTIGVTVGVTHSLYELPLAAGDPRRLVDYSPN